MRNSREKREKANGMAFLCEQSRERGEISFCAQLARSADRHFLATYIAVLARNFPQCFAGLEAFVAFLAFLAVRTSTHQMRSAHATGNLLRSKTSRQRR